MGLLRSEEMSHGTIVLPSDRAREFIDLLGRKSHIQFLDMNANTTKRPYRKQIARIDELERILRCLYEQIERLDATVESGHIDNFLEFDKAYSLDKVEEALQQLYLQFVRFDANNQNLKNERNNTVYEKYVLLAAAATYQASSGVSGMRPSVTNARTIGNSTDHGDDYVGLLGGVQSSAEGNSRNGMLTFSTIAGVIPKELQQRFATILFKATRGNCYTFCHPVEDLSPSTMVSEGSSKSGEEDKAMSVFVVYFQGNASSAMAEKINKIASSFHAKTVPWPSTLAEAESRLVALDSILEEKQSALDAYERYFVSQITILLEPARLNGNSLLEEWRLFCLKEKALYATLNMFEGEDLALRARCWFPKNEEEPIMRLLALHGSSVETPALMFVDREAGRPKPTRGHAKAGALVAPTYYKSNSVMYGFQLLVDTFGIPRYMEANPALVATIMFPFLFGIMYGDIGHGLILFLFALYVCVRAESIKAAKDHPLKGMVDVRYMFLLMGLFSVYAGLIYNDFLAVGHDFFGASKWAPDHTVHTTSGETTYKFSGSAYSFGLDPVWKGAKNELAFLNSMKMKFAIVAGVFHMVLGICMKGLNASFFKAPEDFFFEFVPQMIFMLAMFGYLVFMIIYKWAKTSPIGKPQLISTMINMFLSIGSTLDANDELYSGQSTIQVILVLIIVICIPMMLVPKPFYLKRLHQQEVAAHKRNAALDSGFDDESAVHRRLNVEAGELDALDKKNEHGHHHGADSHHHHAEDEDHFEFGEIMIHQMIETIEFALGAVSNTASYLRLWALSLAHAQLSLVFYQRIMLIALDSSSGVFLRAIITFIAFAAFMCVTTAVILLMDVLECFLHALRLQWVEFQNKFFKADGYKFVPYSHKAILSTVSEE
eukprot:GDKJ01013798.1.p1 GENE.GDKJ01013798.1~~GDKJ01013798.1.p1  ORF type:complete len:887 (+),score=236.79 GDKJ01013798.1:55-2715(+)